MQIIVWAMVRSLIFVHRWWAWQQHCAIEREARLLQWSFVRALILLLGIGILEPAHGVGCHLRGEEHNIGDVHCFDQCGQIVEDTIHPMASALASSLVTPVSSSVSIGYRLGVKLIFKEGGMSWTWVSVLGFWDCFRGLCRDRSKVDKISG